MNIRRLCICLFLFVVLGSCSSGPSSGIDFKKGSFQDGSSFSDFVTTINVGNQQIFAGTTAGAFARSIKDGTDWEPAGLALDSSKVADFVFLEDKILAAVEYIDVRSDDPVLFKSSDDGTSWTAMTDVRKPDSFDYFYIKDLAKGSNSKVIAYSGYIISSIDDGKSWKIVSDAGPGFFEFLYVSSRHPNQIWIGGQTSIYSPGLAKSEDGGQTWTELNQNIYTLSDGMVRDVILHHSNPDKVLAAVYGISRSRDGGESWDPVFDGGGISTFGRSARNPKVIYASGVKRSGNLFFAATRNFGDSWEIVEWSEGPAGMQVNDMVSVVEDGQEVLYLGTNKGVYSYRFED